MPGQTNEDRGTKKNVIYKEKSSVSMTIIIIIVSTSQALSIGNYTVVDVVKGPGHAGTLGPHFIYGPNQGKEIVFLRKNLQSA